MGKKLILALLFLLLAVSSLEAAPAFVQGSQGTAFSTVVSGSLTATTAGNMIVVVMQYERSTLGTVTPPSGYSLAVTLTDTSTSPQVYTAIYYKANSPSITSTSFTVSLSGDLRIYVMEISGVDTSSPFDKSSSGVAYSQNSTPFAATAALASASSIAVSLAYNSSGNLHTWSGGETERYDNYISIGTEVLSSASAYTAVAATTASPAVNIGLTAVFRDPIPATSVGGMMMASD